jgi:hypothetical protein
MVTEFLKVEGLCNMLRARIPLGTALTLPIRLHIQTLGTRATLPFPSLHDIKFNRSPKMAVFWVVAPCSLVEVYQRFGGPCCLHHQGESQGPLKRW